MNNNGTPIDLWKLTSDWFTNNWWIITLILIGAYVVHRVGDTVLTSLIRRTVKHRAHGDISQEDIKKRQDTLIVMSLAIWRTLIWLIAVFSIIHRIFPGIDLTPVLAGASVLGVAVGFGAQTLIKDFLSGLFIILENQYRVGDVVDIDDATGTVEHINLRSTIIRDNNGSVHYIPNGSITHAINKTMGFSKINLTVEVPANTDIDKLSDTINQVGIKLANEEKWKKRVMEPPHFLGIDAFNTNTIDIKIIGKTQPTAQMSVTGELRRRLLIAFKKDGIITVKLPAEK